MSGDEYKIGYGKPPESSQFKPSQSGNPRGRPKGARNLKTDLEEELNEKVTVRESGRLKTISKQRAMVKATTAKAIGGDVRAFNSLAGLAAQLLLDGDPQALERDLSDDEKDILNRYVQEQLHAEPDGDSNE